MKGDITCCGKIAAMNGENSVHVARNTHPQDSTQDSTFLRGKVWWGPGQKGGGVWSWPPEAACSTGGGVWSIAGAGSSGGDHGGGGAGGDHARARPRTGRARACARACAGTQGPGGLCGHALRGEHDCRRVSRRLHRANPCRTTGRPNTTVTVRARVVGWGVGGYGPAGQRRRPVRVGGYGRGARAGTLPYHTPQKVQTQRDRFGLFAGRVAPATEALSR